jgi:hypothetical protein
LHQYWWRDENGNGEVDEDCLANQSMRAPMAWADTWLPDLSLVMKKLGMYGHSGESWYGRHFLNKNDGKVYLFLGRAQNTVYEVKNWKPDTIKKLEVIDAEIELQQNNIWPFQNPLFGS